jgi:hypothetical protein
MNFKIFIATFVLCLPAATGEASDRPTVVENCQSMRRKITEWTATEQADYRKLGCWYKVEADNGAKYQIDLGLIQDLGTGATTSIYSDEGASFNASNLQRWYFTCTGYFSVMQNNMRMRMGPQTYAPPRSVAAQMSEIVCAGAHKSRPNRQMAQAKPSDPLARGEKAIKFYRSRYFLAGFLLRASKVCQGDKQDIEIAFSLLGTNELKAFSQNFPTKSEQWMTEGANNFNTGVLQNGIPETCNYALGVQKKAQQIVQTDQ